MDTDTTVYGRIFTVPNADIGKVMYYLDCDDNNRNESNWADIMEADDRFLLVFAANLSLDHTQ
jgi:hypothetical protein